MLFELRTSPYGLAILLGALVRCTVLDCTTEPSLAEELARRCRAGRDGFKHQPDPSYIPARWSTFSVLARRFEANPIEADSVDLAIAFGAAVRLFTPESRLDVCVDAKGRAWLNVDGEVFDPAALCGAAALSAEEYSSADVGRVPVIDGDSLGCVRRVEQQATRRNLLVEIRTTLQGVTYLLGALTNINLADCLREPDMRRDLLARCSAGRGEGFLYTRDPVWLPDRWTTFAVLHHRARDKRRPYEDDCEGQAAAYGAAVVLCGSGCGLERPRIVEVAISQPEPGKMAHAYDRIDGEVFDPSVFNTMSPPPPEFYESGEKATCRVEAPCPESS